MIDQIKDLALARRLARDIANTLTQFARANPTISTHAVLTALAVMRESVEDAADKQVSPARPGAAGSDVSDASPASTDPPS